MMGSNNHIITSSVRAVSDVRGIKEACRVHTQAASLRLCPTPSHLFTHMCEERNPRHAERNRAGYYGIHASRHAQKRPTQSRRSGRRDGRGSKALGSEVRGHWIY